MKGPQLTRTSQSQSAEACTPRSTRGRKIAIAARPGVEMSPVIRSLAALLLLAIALFLTPSARGLDPKRRISQYAHTAWRIQDGFFNGTPQAITQTADGYLWIGTEGGLMRFDGVRFVPWTPPHGKQLPTNRVHSLLAGRDGSLWIGTERGLAHWNHGDLTNLSSTPAFVDAMVQDSKGVVWIARSRLRDQAGPICEASGSELHCYGASDGIPFPYAQAVLIDGLGNLWVGSSLGICRWKPGDSKIYMSEALAQARGLSGVDAFAAGEDGSVLVGMHRTGKGLGLQHFRDGTWSDYAVPGLDGTKIDVTAMLIDRDHSLWIGTGHQGIYRVHDGRADHLGSADGLSSDSVQGLFEDREGDVWITTSRGIDRLHDVRVVSYSIREGLTSEDVESVLATRDGTVWIGNSAALDILRQDKVSAIGVRNGLPGSLVTSLFEDREGRIWVGVDNDLTVYEHGRFRPIKQADGRALGVVTAIVEDVDGNIWVDVTQPALLRIRDFVVREQFTPPQMPRVQSIAADPKDGLWLGFTTGGPARFRQGKIETISANQTLTVQIRDLLAEPDGSVWGATQQGLFLWKAGKEQRLDSDHGLPCNDVFTLGRDDNGSLWLSTQCGIVMIRASEVERWSQQPDVSVKVKTLDVFDGAQPGQTSFRPRLSKSPNGKLWFANENVLQELDPGRLEGNAVPPPVHVEQIIADRKNYDLAGKLQLPALTRDIEIDYAALSLVVPEKVRFRYKLDGYDTDWQDPQNRRQAFYSNLRPGSYQFRVVACNNDGVWNEAGAAATFTILPAFFQTTWFRLCCVLAATALLWLVYALRLRWLAASIQARFEERLEERARIARDLHDTLLQGIFSASLHFDVADTRLPAESPAKSAMQRGLELLKQVGEEGRNALRVLRARQTADDDLEQALSRLRNEFSLPESTDFRVITEGQIRRLRPLMRDEVYLIAREAIFNAFRHAHASTIEVELDYVSSSLRVLVSDDGRGIDAQVLKAGREGHWGLATMRERAEKLGATFEVLSRPNAGTEIKLSIPGRLAFSPDSPGGLRRWIARFYSEKRGRKIEESKTEDSSEEQQP